MAMEQQIKNTLKDKKNPIKESSTTEKIILALIFIICLIAFHFLIPALPTRGLDLFPEQIYFLNMIPIRGDLFFGILASALLSVLLVFYPVWLKKGILAFSLLVASFVTLFVALHFVFPALPTAGLDAFPEHIYLLGRPIRGDFFFALVLSGILGILAVFFPKKLKAIGKLIFSFWGFKAALSLVDILIFRNLLRASDADNFTMWTVPLLFAFLTNFLPFFLAVALKTHQEGFEDKIEGTRTKKASFFKRVFLRANSSEDNRMKKASSLFIAVTGLLILATAALISNQRWLQMNQSLNASLAHFEDTGPHTIHLDGQDWYIENPPLDELPPFAVMQDFWHLNDQWQPIYGRYQQFLIDFTLLILPLLLIIVTVMASYFNISEKVTNRWYQALEDITDRKKKKMRTALLEMEAAKKLYEDANFSYGQSIKERNREMGKLHTLLSASPLDLSNDVEAFEKDCRKAIREKSLLNMINSYETQINNLHAWVLSDLEVFKAKMAAHHEEVGVQHMVMSIDLNEIIAAYNASVGPIKQFDTDEKTEALMERLITMNKERI